MALTERKLQDDFSRSDRGSQCNSQSFGERCRDDHRQLQEPFPGGHVGHIGHPGLIGAAGPELSLDEVFGQRVSFVQRVVIEKPRRRLMHTPCSISLTLTRDMP